ncbi:MAG: PTS sugar transporter subunit IIA [Candidatus Sumerlaeia bacterium]
MELSVKETADFLDVSPRTIYRWLKEGSIPHSRVGSQYRFRKSDLQDWAATRGQKTLGDAPESRQFLNILQALDRGGIYFNIDGRTPEDALEEFVSLLRLPQEVSRERLLEELIEREHISSTSVGDSVAIPHTRSPIAEIQSTHMSIAFLRTRQHWHSIDGQGVQILILPISPTIETHLQFLSRLHCLLRSDAWRNINFENTTRNQIRQAIQAVEDQLAEKK